MGSNSFVPHGKSGNSDADPSFRPAWWTPRLAEPVIAAAVARLTLLAVALTRVGTRALISLDTPSYLDPGRNLLFHGRYVAGGVPDLLRPPGYPLFLAITALPGLPVAALANAILSVFSVILIWRLAQAIFRDDRIAIGAAWIFAFEPLTILFSVVLLSDTLFTVFLLLGLERVAEFLRSRRLRVIAFGGVWFAAATFARPVTYYLPFLLAAGLFFTLLRKPGIRWKAPAVLLISTLPWLAAWQVRNWVETGYGGFSNITEINLYFWDAAGITARVTHQGYGSVRSELGDSGAVDGAVAFTGLGYLSPTYLASHPEQSGWNQGQRLAYIHSQALQVIRTHSEIYSGACLSGLAKTLFDTDARFFDALVDPGQPQHIADTLRDQGLIRGTITFAKAHPWVALEKGTLAFVMLGLYVLAVRGIFRCGMRSAYLWLLLGTALYFVVTSALVVPMIADARYRLPAMPIICILASAGLGRKRTIGDNKAEVSTKQGKL